MQEEVCKGRVSAKEDSAAAIKKTSKMSEPARDVSCRKCMKMIPAGTEFCPECGTYLSRDNCSFCGFMLEEEDRFCPECGNPREGIVCPECGALSMRSFCSGCNAPLNDLAWSELERAGKDAVFGEMKAVARTLGALEEDLGIGDGARLEERLYRENLLREYRELLEAGGAASPDVTKQPGRTAPEPVFVEMTREEKEALYHRKLLEMQALMDSLKPDEGVTPHEQRNYYSARKLPGVKDVPTRVPVGWECNYCRCRHHSPSGCVYPELGGRWVYGKNS